MLRAPLTGEARYFSSWLGGPPPSRSGRLRGVSARHFGFPLRGSCRRRRLMRWPCMPFAAPFGPAPVRPARHFGFPLRGSCRRRRLMRWPCMPSAVPFGPAPGRSARHFGFPSRGSCRRRRLMRWPCMPSAVPFGAAPVRPARHFGFPLRGSCRRRRLMRWPDMPFAAPFGPAPGRVRAPLWLPLEGKLSPQATDEVALYALHRPVRAGSGACPRAERRAKNAFRLLHVAGFFCFSHFFANETPRFSVFSYG